jgi:5'-methylthioadenosine phosphorylase
MKLNVAVAQQAICNLARMLPKHQRECRCGDALRGAIITERAVIPSETIARLQPIIGKYLS